ncbi:MAG: ferredoxin--NADP reductase, partial [Pseudomonadota bacterium]|nr:ferredoxin--NADP reductase [Pseudomonadota bacterium]
DRLTYFTSVTQEDYPNRDRVMICGSIEMLQDLSAIVEEKGFAEGSNANPGEYVIEKAFVG